jgi:hypothetical protein
MINEVRPIRVEDPATFPTRLNHALNDAEHELLAAPGAGRKIQVTGLLISSAAANAITLYSLTGTTYAAVLGPIYMAANQTVWIPFTHTLEIPVNYGLSAKSTAADLVTIQVFGYIDGI